MLSLRYAGLFRTHRHNHSPSARLFYFGTSLLRALNPSSSGDSLRCRENLHGEPGHEYDVGINGQRGGRFFGMAPGHPASDA